MKGVRNEIVHDEKQRPNRVIKRLSAIHGYPPQFHLCAAGILTL